MEENRRRVAALKAILDRAENRQCADCRASGGTVRPSWASINTGVFICMRCAGIHRGLGVHISKVHLWMKSRLEAKFDLCNCLAVKFCRLHLSRKELHFGRNICD